MPLPILIRPPAGRSVQGEVAGRNRDSQPQNILGAIEACIPALRRYSAALLRDRDKADDAVHRCLLQALDSLHSMRADGDVKLRLFCILQQILDRTMRRRRFRSLTGAMPAHHGDTASPEPGQEEVGPWSDLLRRLECLPDRQRSVVLLISVENLTYTAAAAILGISATAVMQLLATGRERLRQVSTELSPDMGMIS